LPFLVADYFNGGIKYCKITRLAVAGVICPDRDGNSCNREALIASANSRFFGFGVHFGFLSRCLIYISIHTTAQDTNHFATFSKSFFAML
jgi:hypothetical protein